MILKIYTDGGSKGNPGPSSIGGVGYSDGKKYLSLKNQLASPLIMMRNIWH